VAGPLELVAVAGGFASNAAVDVAVVDDAEHPEHPRSPLAVARGDDRAEVGNGQERVRWDLGQDPARLRLLPAESQESRPARVSSSTRRSARSSSRWIASDLPEDGAPTSISQSGSSSARALETPAASTALMNASSDSAGSPVNDDLDHGGEGRAGLAAEAAVAVRDERGAARARGTERQRGVAAAGGTGCEVFAPAVKAERQHAPGEASLFFVARGLLAQTALDTRSCGCP
jgi:hypothetical protein